MTGQTSDQKEVPQERVALPSGQEALELPEGGGVMIVGEKRDEIGAVVEGTEVTPESAVPAVIVKPEDPQLIKRLEAKLAEYKKRKEQGKSFAPYAAPETPYAIYVKDTALKIAVLEAVLTKGRCVTGDLAMELQKEHEGAYSPELFANACKVINAYAEGKTVRGGTGLPEV